MSGSLSGNRRVSFSEAETGLIGGQNEFPPVKRTRLLGEVQATLCSLIAQ